MLEVKFKRKRVASGRGTGSLFCYVLAQDNSKKVIAEVSAAGRNEFGRHQRIVKDLIR